MIVIDWSQSQLDTLRAEAFHRFINTSARVRALAVEDYQRTTMLAPIKPPPEVVTGEYLPPGTGRGHAVHGTIYNWFEFTNDPLANYRRYW